MDWLDPLDTAMLAADVVSNPLNIGAVLILSPPPDAGPGYVDELFREGLAGRALSIRGFADIRIADWRPAASGSGRKPMRLT